MVFPFSDIHKIEGNLISKDESPKHKKKRHLYFYFSSIPLVLLIVSISLLAAGFGSLWFLIAPSFITFVVLLLLSSPTKEKKFTPDELRTFYKKASTILICTPKKLREAEIKSSQERTAIIDYKNYLINKFGYVEGGDDGFDLIPTNIDKLDYNKFYKFLDAGKSCQNICKEIVKTIGLPKVGRFIIPQKLRDRLTNSEKYSKEEIEELGTLMLSILGMPELFSSLSVKYDNSGPTCGFYKEKDLAHIFYSITVIVHPDFSIDDLVNVIAHEICHRLIVSKKIHYNTDFRNEEMADILTVYLGVKDYVIPSKVRSHIGYISSNDYIGCAYALENYSNIFGLI